jgi:hypothetical protein
LVDIPATQKAPGAGDKGGAFFLSETQDAKGHFNAIAER